MLQMDPDWDFIEMVKTSSLLVQSIWDFSGGARSKGVRPMLLQILLQRWEWKNKAMPRTPGKQILSEWSLFSNSCSEYVAAVCQIERYLDFHLQSQSPSLCGSEGLCRDLRLPGCQPRSTGGPTAQMRSDWRPGGKEVKVILVCQMSASQY